MPHIIKKKKKIFWYQSLPSSFWKHLTLKEIGQLAEKMVEMKNDVSYPLVYSWLWHWFYQLQQLLLKEFF